MLSKIISVICLVLTIWLLIQTYSGSHGYKHLKTLEANLEGQKAASAKLESYVKNLEERLYKLNHDDRYLEKTVRGRMLLGKKNEEIYMFKGK